MQVACCQFDICWEDKPANYAHVRQLVELARLAQGTLLLLPEMFATGFSMNADAIAEPAGGPTFAFLSELSQQHGIYIVAGAVVTAEIGRPRNEALTFGPKGNLISRYAKMHLFTFAGEHHHYDAGELPATSDSAGCTFAPIVCYDLRFPELFRRGMKAGAKLFTVIANWPAARASHWHALLRARAIENQAYVAAVNRIGNDPYAGYSGGSVIIDPRGEVVADAGGDGGIIRAKIDLDAVDQYRSGFTALIDARDDLLG